MFYFIQNLIRKIQYRINSGSSETLNLTEGVIWKQIVRFALPLLLSNFLQQLYNTADLMIVGNFASGESMAAVGSTGSLSSLIIGFFIGLGTGASVVISQYYGAGDDRMVSKSVHTAVTLSFISGIIITVLGLFLSPILLELMGTPQDIIEYSNIYMSIIFTGIIPTIVYNMGAGILRAVGDSKRPLYYLICSIVINFALDLLFVAGFHWDTAGAAIATVISQCVAMLLTLLNLLKTDASYKLTFRGLGLNWGILKKIISIGVPAGLQSTMFAISNVVIQSKINSFGSIAVAGLAAAGRIDGFIYIVLNSVALSILTFVGQNMGARKYGRVRQAVRSGLIISLISTIFISLVVYVFGPNILACFNPDPDVIGFGMKMVTTMAASYWIFGMSEVLTSSMRGSGYSTVPMIVSITFICGVRLLWLEVMLPIWNDILAVTLAYPISWTITFFVTLILYLSKRWLKLYIKKHPSDSAEAPDGMTK